MKRFLSETGVSIPVGIFRMLRRAAQTVREATSVSGLAPVTRSGARRPIVQARLAEPWAQDGSKNIARISEKAPPGFEDVVKALKKKSGVDEPYAVAWSMYNQGHSARAAMRLTEDEEQLQRFMQDEHDEDVPLDSFKSDVRRKTLLHQVMGKPNEEGILDDLMGDESLCVDRDSGEPVDCDDDNAIPRDEYEATEATGRDPRKGLKSFGMEPSEAEVTFRNGEREARGEEPMVRKEEANYRYSSDPAETCGGCRFFVEPGACQKVFGLIRRVDVCDLFQPSRAQAAKDTFKSEYTK